MSTFFNKIFGWITNILPPEYSIAVGIKKAAYMAGKLAISFLLTSKAGGFIQSHTTPDQVQTVQTAITVSSAAVLEALHDWLKLKFPNATWL